MSARRKVLAPSRASTSVQSPPIAADDALRDQLHQADPRGREIGAADLVDHGGGEGGGDRQTARMPRQAFAVPRTIAIAVPRITARSVSSGRLDVSETYGVNEPDDGGLLDSMRPFCATEPALSPRRPAKAHGAEYS